MSLKTPLLGLTSPSPFPLTTVSAVYTGLSKMYFLSSSWSISFLLEEAQNESIFTGKGFSGSTSFRSMGPQLHLLSRSLSFTEPSTYVSNTKSMWFALLHRPRTQNLCRDHRKYLEKPVSYGADSPCHQLWLQCSQVSTLMVPGRLLATWNHLTKPN